MSNICDGNLSQSHGDSSETDVKHDEMRSRFSHFGKLENAVPTANIFISKQTKNYNGGIKN